MAAKRI